MAAPRSDLPGTGGGLAVLSLFYFLSLEAAALPTTTTSPTPAAKPIPIKTFLTFPSLSLQQNPIAASKRLRADEPASAKDMEMDRE